MVKRWADRRRGPRLRRRRCEQVGRMLELQRGGGTGQPMDPPELHSQPWAHARGPAAAGSSNAICSASACSTGLHLLVVGWGASPAAQYVLATPCRPAARQTAVVNVRVCTSLLAALCTTTVAKGCQPDEHNAQDFTTRVHIRAARMPAEKAAAPPAAAAAATAHGTALRSTHKSCTTRWRAMGLQGFCKVRTLLAT